MSLKVKKQKTLPKYWLGGILGGMGKMGGGAGGGQGLGGLFGQLGGAAGGAAGQPAPPMEGANASFMKSQAQGQKIGQGIESAVGSFGPIGMAVAGASKLAGKAFGANKFGEHSSTTSKVLDNSLNMQAGAAKLMTNAKGMFSGNLKGDEVADQLSLGLFGKSRAEKEGAEMKEYMNWKKTNDAALQNSVNSNLARVPQATAPLYGRKGLKLTTKYSKMC